MNRFILSLAALALSAPLMAQDPQIPADKAPKTLASGLKVDILTEGSKDGRHPQLGDQVTVHYTGWLTNGTVFDSSKKRGTPAKFKIGQVIEGWNEGLAHMTPGTTAKLTIPSHLGYGPQGQGTIPPNSTLIFEVELIDVAAGPELPAFTALNADKAKTTESGIKYEVVTAGTGDPASADDNLEMTFSIWTTEGKMVDCSLLNGRNIVATPSKLNLACLKEAAMLIPAGGKYRMEVPASLAFGERPYKSLAANAASIWEIEVIKVTAMPKFSGTDKEKAKDVGEGLLIETLREGSGDAPTTGQQVQVHYTGWTTDGKQFDSSLTRGTPFSFTVGSGVIEGWSKGVQHMKPGGLYKITIPSALGYGERGAGGAIPPNATLIFQIEVLQILGK